MSNTTVLLLLSSIACAENEKQLPDLALLAVEKSHSEVVTESPHTWKININSETPIENQSITIEVLKGISKNPSLKSNSNVGFSSLKAIVDDVISQGMMTDEEKALSLWRFVMDNAYHGAWGTSMDGLEHLNVYGYGYCGTFVAALEPLWWAAGLKARHVNIGNHAATEVFYDNDWHYIDAHQRCFFLEKDNKTIASLEDLNYIPELWDMKRKTPSLQKGQKKYYYMSMHPHDHGRSPVYSKKFNMSKGDMMILTWQKNGKWCLERGAEGGGKPAPEPAIYANGTFRFLRDLSNFVYGREGLVSSKNVNWDDSAAGYLHPEKITEEAYLIYEVRVPYFIPSTTILGKFLRKNPDDLIAIDISTDNGQHWETHWEANETGIVNGKFTTEKTQEVTTDKPWKYSYLLRIRMKEEKNVQDTGIYSIASDSDLFYNPRSLPGLKNGENTLTFQDEGIASRSVKVTYKWRENLPVKISKELPLDKEEVKLECRVSNIGRAKAKNVAVVFYEGDPQKGGVEICKDLIGQIEAGKVETAKVKWRPTRWDSKSKGITDGIEIFVVVDPENSIKESNEDNNVFSRTVKILNPPEVIIPSESFIKFDSKKDNPNVMIISTTIRNFSSSPKYGHYLNDHATAEKVTVKFFDGDPKGGKQIGTDQIIQSLKPLEVKNASVEWNISKLNGQHKIYVQVLTPENIVKVFGPQKPEEMSTTVDLDKYPQCIANRR